VITLAITALAVLAYTFVGYPLLIAVLARIRPLKARESLTWEPVVTACIPAHEGAAFVGEKIDSLRALDWPREKLEILIYDDGSTDDTAKIAAARGARVIRGGQRAGKPTALAKMAADAKGEVLLLTDIRQPLEKSALRALVRRLADPNVACVSGNLTLRGGAGAGLYWRYENWIRASEATFRSMLGATGPIYVVRKADLGEIPSDTILDDMWIPMRLRLRRKRLLFAPEAVAWDDAFADEREFRRKVRTLAGNYQLFARLPLLLIPIANPSWLETMSHKVLRLLCPWALLLLAVASMLDRRLQWLLLAQAAFYLLAAVGPRATKLGTLARTFVVLHAAAVVGLLRYVRGTQRVTW